MLGLLKGNLETERVAAHIKGMNRREFTMGLVAAGTASTIPAGALPAASASTTATAGFTHFQYRSSVFLAQMEGRCSAKLIAERFGMSPASAEAVQTHLIRKGYVTAPNALGVSRATPMTSRVGAAGTPGSAAPKPSVGAGKKTKLGELRERVWDRLKSESDQDLAEAEAPSQADVAPEDETEIAASDRSVPDA